MNIITYKEYNNEQDLPKIMKMIENDLSEPYSIFTYRYFLNTWKYLSFIAIKDNNVIGVVISKIDTRTKPTDILTKQLARERGEPIQEQVSFKRGYIGMLAVEKKYRRQGIGRKLVQKSIQAMEKHGCIQVALETEAVNESALKLYQGIGFIRDKRLEKYYLNGGDAFRLKLDLNPTTAEETAN